ncbi:hypothetical protein AOZ06_08620 [Kibdelosporangium phytohabitans]|uniref:Uncharacterized protein n=2 Tax=Kibdelosporangium phytohabitans TaxID=860235 RepID=A0A0N9HXL4_9PSEU|nr:hypothetical protein AOZ06_08620 [Kibdelosporangium phytohabitans]
MARTMRRPTLDWTRTAAERARDVNGGVRGRTHRAGNASLGRHPQRHWITTLGIFTAGVVIGAAAAVSSLRRTFATPVLAVVGSEDEATDSAVPSETPVADRSR